MRKLIICLTLVVSCFVMLFPADKASAHVSPINGGPCNNTYYRLEDFMESVSHRYSTHYVVDGLCYRYYFIYNHKKYCNQCNYYWGFGETYECTENHSICDVHSKDCDEIKP